LDDSGEGCKVGAAVFGNGFASGMGLPDDASVFAAESIYLALSYKVQRAHDELVMFSNSLSVLVSIKNEKSDNVVVRRLLLRFVLGAKSFKLYWIPSRVGVRGGEKVDALAEHYIFNELTCCCLLVILDWV
jgi:hypothetical protein